MAQPRSRTSTRARKSGRKKQAPKHERSKTKGKSGKSSSSGSSGSSYKTPKPEGYTGHRRKVKGNGRKKGAPAGDGNRQKSTQLMQGNTSQAGGKSGQRGRQSWGNQVQPRMGDDSSTVTPIPPPRSNAQITNLKLRRYEQDMSVSEDTYSFQSATGRKTSDADTQADSSFQTDHTSTGPELPVCIQQSRNGLRRDLMVEISSGFDAGCNHLRPSHPFLHGDIENRIMLYKSMRDRLGKDVAELEAAKSLPPIKVRVGGETKLATAKSHLVKTNGIEAEGTHVGGQFITGVVEYQKEKRIVRWRRKVAERVMPPLRDHDSARKLGSTVTRAIRKKVAHRIRPSHDPVGTASLIALAECKLQPTAEYNRMVKEGTTGGRIAYLELQDSYRRRGHTDAIQVPLLSGNIVSLIRSSLGSLLDTPENRKLVFMDCSRNARALRLNEDPRFKDVSDSDLHSIITWASGLYWLPSTAVIDHDHCQRASTTIAARAIQQEAAKRTAGGKYE